ncbi:Amino acid transporter [Forsythia ovata]|uniref:Amino acid transporter n=1 Tax=Forsythia ovata TaxID=205694 RepID=A0ABD1RMI7_9LAMI
MAGLAFLPKFFAFRSKWFNTPSVGILLSTVVALGVSYMDYTDIISSANFLYSLGMLLEFASFLLLRRKFPTRKRPYGGAFEAARNGAYVLNTGWIFGGYNGYINQNEWINDCCWDFMVFLDEVLQVKRMA